MKATDEERLARAALCRIAEPGDAELGGYVAASGAAAVLAAILDATLPTRRLAHYRTRAGAADPAADLDRAANEGIRLVCPGDLEWPSQLEDLGDRRPLALWIRGEADLRRCALRSVSVVGSRACTEYGQHVAAELAAVLAERGYTVVSGAAYGIDGAAHRGALAAGGATVAVLACGVDVAYPQGHEGLLRRIAEGDGLLASELPPGCGVTKGRFLTRNRVIAALTRGTVVVEAAVRSGALSTAGRARDLSRWVMAVPGPVTSAASAGCHELVRAQGASLVTGGEDVLDLVGDLGVDDRPLRRGQERPTDALDAEVMRVLDALLPRRSRSVDTLVPEAGLSLPTVLRCLGQLHALGLTEPHEDGWRLAR